MDRDDLQKLRRAIKAKIIAERVGGEPGSE
jgi:hypothetical protein